jgi:DNA-binding transcriptional LysR family regulator
MEIYQLRAFVTAARLGNLTRTAEALHLTQPAITGQIKALEEGLGVTLFERRPGGISLTRSGELLLPEAEQVLNAAGRLQGRARELQGQVAGHLVVGIPTDPESLRLGSTLAWLAEQFPLLEIKTRQGPAEELRDMVVSGLLPTAFYIGTQLPREVVGVALQTLHYRIVGAVRERQALLAADWRELAEMPWQRPAGHPHLPGHHDLRRAGGEPTRTPSSTARSSAASTSSTPPRCTRCRPARDLRPTETIIGRWLAAAPACASAWCWPARWPARRAACPGCAAAPTTCTPADIVQACDDSLRACRPTDRPVPDPLAQPQRAVFGACTSTPPRTAQTLHPRAAGGAGQAGAGRQGAPHRPVQRIALGRGEFVRLAEQHGLPRMAGAEPLLR